MEKPLLILLSGHPASGKTTLSKKIADKLRLPVISLDDIKEMLWDNLGWKHNREEWDKFGAASFALMYHFVQVNLAQGKSIIADAPFRPEMNKEKIAELKKKHDCELIQIFCYADKKVLVERFEKRISSDDYHPGHANGLYNIYDKDDFISKFGERNSLLEIDGKTLKVDTTNPEDIDYEEIFEFIETNN